MNILTSYLPTLRLRKHFLWQWILATTLTYGFGVAVLGLGHDSAQSILLVVLSGLVLGFTQWLVLRPFPIDWIFVYVFYPCCYLIAGSFLGGFWIDSPWVSIILLLSLPIILPIAQWRLLRKFIRPCWTWILSSFAIYSLTFIAWLIVYSSLVIHLEQNTQIRLVFGLVAGVINGILSGLVLIELVKKAQPISPAIQQKITQGKYDNPPDQKLWIQNIVNLSIIPLFVGWFFLIPEPNISLGNLLIFFITLYGYLFLSILVHELGHLSFALLNRFRFKFLAVDRWVLSQSSQGLRIERFNRLAAGGLTATVPTMIDTTQLKNQLIWMIFGGPLASFLLFLLGSIFLLFPELVLTNPVVWSLTFLSIYNLYMTILNLLPIKFGYFPTDGRLIWNLTHSNPEGKRFMAFYRHLGSLAQGIRPRDLDPEILSDALAIPESSMHHISGLMMAYQRALDRGEFQVAGEFLDQALELKQYWPEFNRAALFLEGTYFEARIRNQPEIARQWFEQIQEQPLIESYSLLRAEAALLLVEFRSQEAVTKAEHALQLAKQDLLSQGSAIAEIEWLQAIIHEGIQKQKAS